MHTYLQEARAYSLFLNRHLEQNQINLHWMKAHLDRPLNVADFEQFAPWQTLSDAQDEAGFKKSLRQLRLHVVSHIICRDICRASSLMEVTQTITHLAEFAVLKSLPIAHNMYSIRHGQPIGMYSQAPQSLTVIAMGKMGGHELNVSSDIDLIFTFPESGQTNGKRVIDNQEFFIKVGKKLIQLIDDITPDGQVFRVDMRLRPNGDAGALAISETALEQYLVTQGREWERYAWLKARVISTGDNDIKALVRPFVYRKYLDFSTYEGLRDLHLKIRQEVAKKDRFDNIKLGIGGIREIEFITQVFQLIRGGQLPVLQRKDTQGTLKLLGQMDIISPKVSSDLLSAYRFLRDCEHRLQYYDDQQTQTLPLNEHEQHLLANSMGFADYTAFYQRLNGHRLLVNAFFTSVLAAPEDQSPCQEHPLWAIWQQNTSQEETADFFKSQGFDASVIERLNTIYHSNRYQSLSDNAQKRFTHLLPLVFELAKTQRNPSESFIRSLDFLETISRRTAYLALLTEKPQSLSQLVKILSSSQWMANYLNRHPILIDELLSSSLLETQYNWAELRTQIDEKLATFGDDVEGKMDALRHFQHAHLFQLAVQDVHKLWTIEALSDELSALADCVIAVAIKHAWLSVKKRHCDVPQFAVIGYGRLGGKELGYASDLDLVYVYQDGHPDAVSNYTRLSQRLTSWLSTTTGAGMLYQVDLRLRPDGDAGFVCTEWSAFERYQLEKAWTWEHQALTRARFVAGDSLLGEKFENFRCDILRQPRDISRLKEDILEMRAKMQVTHPADNHNVKYARGGVVDIEFMVQYLILAFSNQYPKLTLNHGNIALVRIAAEKNLLDQQHIEDIQAAYRFYRAIQHQSLINEHAFDDNEEELLQYYQVVKEYWQQILS